MKMKQTTLAAALTAMLALGVSGQAAADVYAGSSLLFQNMHLTTFDGGIAPANVSPQPFTSYQFTVTNTATLNGVSAASNTKTCSGTPSSSSCGALITLETATAANAPGGDPAAFRANNATNFFGPALQYSNSDSTIFDSQITGDAATRTGQVAESSIISGANAGANAEIQSTTGFVFQFVLNQAGSLVFEFESDPALRAAISGAITAGSSQANINTTISLTQESTGDEITWSPQGTLGNNCDAGIAGAVCVEARLDAANADGVDLNRNLSTSTIPNDLNHDLIAMFYTFGIQMTGLAAGNYTLALNAVSSTQVSQQIPEPATLALLGLGLLGMGVTMRRKA